MSSIAWSSSSSGSRSSVTVGGEVAVSDAAFGDLVADRASREDLERVEVEVDRVRVAGEVDQLPDLVLAEHREERRRVLEVGGDGAVAGGLLAVGDRDAAGRSSPSSAIASSRMVSMFGSPSSSRSTSAIARRGAPASASARRRLVVGRELARDRPSRGPSASATTRKRMTCGIRQQAVEIGGVLGVGGRERGAVERGGGGVEQRQLAAGREVGEVDEQVGALGRGEHEPVRRHGHGARSSPWSVPICVIRSSSGSPSRSSTSR